MLGYHCSCCYSNKRHPRLLSVTKTLTAFYLTKKVLVKKDVKCEHAQRDFAISDAATESFRNKTTIFIESFSEYLNQANTQIHSGIKPNDCIVSFWANYSCQSPWMVCYFQYIFEVWICALTIMADVTHNLLRFGGRICSELHPEEPKCWSSLRNIIFFIFSKL